MREVRIWHNPGDTPLIEDLPTAEFTTPMILIPDGTGGVQWVPLSTVSSSGIVLWGNYDIGSVMTALYLSPGNDGSGIATAVPIQFRSPRAGTMANFYVRQNIIFGTATKSITYTLRKNNVDTLLSVTMSAASQDGNDIVNTVTVAKGDLLDIKVTKSAVSVGDSPLSVVVAAELV